MKRKLQEEKLQFQEARVLEDVQAGGVRFEAVVSEADHINQNNRLYPQPLLFGAFESLNQNPSHFPGTVDHPGGFFDDNASVADLGIVWEGFTFEDKKVIGRGRTIPTQKGKDLEAVIRAGVPIGFSTRGYGDHIEEVEPITNRKYKRVTSLELETVDAVTKPSVDHARIRHYATEDISTVNEEELRKKIEAEVTLKFEAARAVEQKELAEAQVAGLKNDLAAAQAQIAERDEQIAALRGQLTEAQSANSARDLDAKLAELTTGHPFAATIIAKAKEAGATVESAEVIVGAMKSMSESAGAKVNTNEGARGAPVSQDEDEVISASKFDERIDTNDELAVLAEQAGGRRRSA